MTRRDGEAEPMIQRARDLAAGLADVGLAHAEDLLRRVSPEGREQARREREARARRRRRLIMRLMLGAVAALLTWALVAALLSPAVAFAAATAVMLLAAVLVSVHAEPRRRGRQALTDAALPALAEETSIWLAAQRQGLPRPALRLSEEIGRRLHGLAPQLEQIDPRSPAAAALRKLMAEELPDLVVGWRSVPVSLRKARDAGGRTPDDHLVGGLTLIEAELASAGEQLGSGSLAEIAVLGRYLELKYDSGARVS